MDTQRTLLKWADHFSAPVFGAESARRATSYENVTNREFLVQRPPARRCGRSLLLGTAQRAEYFDDN